MATLDLSKIELEIETNKIEALKAAALSIASTTKAAVDRAALISFLTLVVQVGGACFLAYVAYKQAALSQQQIVIGKTVETLEKNTNSLMDKLIKKEKNESRAQGNAEGQAEVKADIKRK